MSKVKSKDEIPRFVLEMKAVKDESGRMDRPEETRSRDGLFYGLAVLFGIGSGVVHVTVEDPLLTALSVVVFTMFLGFMRPKRPWRWTLLVGLLVPIVMVVANLLHYYQTFSRAGLYGSGLIILPGIAGAYGGSVARNFMREVFFKKN